MTLIYFIIQWRYSSLEKVDLKILYNVFSVWEINNWATGADIHVFDKNCRQKFSYLLLGNPNNFVQRSSRRVPLHWLFLIITCCPKLFNKNFVREVLHALYWKETENSDLRMGFSFLLVLVLSLGIICKNKKKKWRPAYMSYVRTEMRAEKRMDRWLF